MLQLETRAHCVCAFSLCDKEENGVIENLMEIKITLQCMESNGQRTLLITHIRSHSQHFYSLPLSFSRFLLISFFEMNISHMCEGG